MKRRTAILLSGALLCSMGGYVAWCFRAFYLKPQLEFDVSVSADGREAVKRWAETSGYPGPREFERNLALWNLMHPWNSHPSLDVWANEDHGGGLWTSNHDHLWGFSKSGGKWDHSTVVEHMVRGLHTGYLQRQAEAASRLEAWVAEGVTMEIFLLKISHLPRHDPAEDEPLLSLHEPPKLFHGYPVARHAVVSQPRGRQELLEEFARAVREADIPVGGRLNSSLYGVTLTRGDEKWELLLSFTGENGYAQSYAAAGSGLSDDFDVGFRAWDAFDAVLETSANKPTEPEAEVK